MYLPLSTITVTMLSATATFGLIILYDTIFKHGALTVATVMTCRQFWSIIMNAGIFGNFGSVGFGGWLGGKRYYRSSKRIHFARVLTNPCVFAG
jgi:hypothetical protein